MEDIASISVADIVFKKPIVYGNFLLRKVDGVRVGVTLPQSRVQDKVIKSAQPHKTVVQQLLRLEESVRCLLGDKKYLTPMIVVSNGVGCSGGPQIVCQLNMHKAEEFPIDEFGSVSATLIGIKISGQCICVLWRATSFSPEPELNVCNICDEADDQDEEGSIEVDQLTLIDIKQSLVDAYNSSKIICDAHIEKLLRVKELLSNSDFIPSDLESARSILDDLE